MDLGAMIPTKFARKHFVRISGDEMDDMTSEMSDYFLELIRKDSSEIDFDVL